jgi:hypothetical protein
LGKYYFDAALVSAFGLEKSVTFNGALKRVKLCIYVTSLLVLTWIKYNRGLTLPL